MNSSTIQLTAAHPAKIFILKAKFCVNFHYFSIFLFFGGLVNISKTKIKDCYK